MSFRVRQELDLDIWREFVRRQPNGNIFHTPEMFHVFAATPNQHPTLWSVQDGQGSVQALCVPVSITLLGGLLRRPTTRAVSYGSVLFQSSNRGRDALEVLLRHYVQDGGRRNLFTELRNLADLNEIQPLLQRCGFEFEPHLNYLIDLDRPPEAILQAIGKSTRKRIRQRLRRKDVIIDEVMDVDGLAEWYAVLEKTYSRAQVPLPDRSMFEAVFRLLVPAKMARFFSAHVDSAVAAVSLILYYGETVYGWYGGTDRGYGNYAPKEFLIWHVLKTSSEQGYRIYDFGGAGRPGEEYGVRDFKAKFGGQLVNYGRNTLVHSPVGLWFSRVGYQILRGMMTRGSLLQR